MEGFERKYFLVSLIDKMRSRESWCSETHIQKSIYFMQVVFNIPTKFDFLLYKHGPFSFDLRDELNEMVALGFSSLKYYPPYGPSYDDGPYLEPLKVKYSDSVEVRRYDEEVNFVAEKISIYPTSELERLMTALYFIKEKNINDKNECARAINEIKAHISLEEARDAFDQINHLMDEACLV